MPPVEITVPRLGWSMEEGVFIGWLKREGDPVKAGEPLFTLESEKSTEDIESLDDGVLRLLDPGPRQGEIVKVGQILGHLVTSGATVALPPRAAPTPPAAPRVVLPPVSTHIESKPIKRGPRSTPRARRRAAALGFDWTTLQGSGEGGRIRDADVLAAASSRPPSAPAPGPLRPHSTIRRTIAQRMLSSHQSTAPVTLTTTANASNLVALRDQFRSAAPDSDQPVPTLNDILVKLSAIALKAHPELNARWEDDGIALLPDVHVAIAVDTPDGLLAPVVRHVDRLGIRDLARQTRRLLDLARQGRLPSSDLDGGTFTLTNLGAYGVEFFTPLINPPQAAILGIGALRQRPGRRSRSVLPLSLTFDHRITDGGPAARFLQTFVAAVENPADRLIG